MLQILTDSTVQAAVQQVAEIVASLGVVVGVYLLNRFFGIKISQANVDKLKGAAATEAGALVAKAEDNLKSRAMTVNDPAVASAADKIAERNPDTVKAVGATQDTLKQYVLGEIGKLQVQQTGDSK